MMDEDTFNMEIRRFLKQVGVTSQREIERATAQAVAGGRVAGGSAVSITATISAPEIDLSHKIEGELKIAD